MRIALLVLVLAACASAPRADRGVVIGVWQFSGRVGDYPVSGTVDAESGKAETNYGSCELGRRCGTYAVSLWVSPDDPNQVRVSFELRVPGEVTERECAEWTYDRFGSRSTCKKYENVSKPGYVWKSVTLAAERVR